MARWEKKSSLTSTTELFADPLSSQHRSYGHQKAPKALHQVIKWLVFNSSTLNCRVHSPPWQCMTTIWPQEDVRAAKNYSHASHRVPAYRSDVKGVLLQLESRNKNPIQGRTRARTTGRARAITKSIFVNLQFKKPNQAGLHSHVGKTQFLRLPDGNNQTGPKLPEMGWFTAWFYVVPIMFPCNPQEQCNI